MNTSTEDICHQWLYDLVDTNSTSLEELNEAFKKRHIGGIVFILCLIFIGIIGNIHVLWIYIRFFRPSNYRTYVLCLAALDMTNCTIGMPLTVVYLNFPLKFPSDTFCKVYRFCLYYVSITSAFIFVIIAIDRYVKICRPTKRHLTDKETTVVCIMGLLFGLVFSWPAPLLYGQSEINLPRVSFTGRRCFTADSLKDLSYQKIFNAVLSVMFVTIITLISVLYYHVTKAVRKHTRFQTQIREKSRSANTTNTQGTLRRAGANKYQRNLRRTTITLLVVTVGFIASAVPHNVLAICIFAIPKFECTLGLSGGIAYYTFIWIFMLNNVINPVIYLFCDKTFWLNVKAMYSRNKATQGNNTTPQHSESNTLTVDSRNYI